MRVRRLTCREHTRHVRHVVPVARDIPALVEFLAEYYGVPKRSVRIASGLKSRLKRVVIDA